MQKGFSRFGTNFTVRAKDMYTDPEDSSLICISWDALCEGETSPPQVVSLAYEVLSDSTRQRIAEKFLKGINIRDQGEILILNVFEDSPDPWQNHSGTSVQWHTRLKTFNPRAWAKAA